MDAMVNRNEDIQKLNEKKIKQAREDGKTRSVLRMIMRAKQALMNERRMMMMIVITIIMMMIMVMMTDDDD